MIFTALSPNTQKDDFKLACKVLLRPPEYLEGDYPLKVKEWFKNFFKAKYVAVYESARTALYFTLKELGVKQGDEVIIQAFTCVAAVNPIKWAGAKPVFVDIDPLNFNLDFDDLVNKVNGKTRVIIVQHTFGYPAEIDKIIKFAKSKGICVIEDCAHTIGTEYDNKKLGTFGDAAIFSLGRDKSISGSFGGVIITNSKKIGKRLEEAESFLNCTSKKWIARQILYTITAYLTRRLYDILALGKFIHFVLTRSGLLLKATTKGEKQSGEMPAHAKSQLPNALARLALNQLEKLSKFNKRRYEVTNIYVKNLKRFKLSKVTLPEWKVSKNFFPIRFPLLVKKRDELMEFAKNKRVLLGDWYDTPVAPKQVDLSKTGYMQGSCPNAEEVCRNIINLPLHINLSKKDALEVIAVIKDFYGKYFFSSRQVGINKV